MRECGAVGMQQTSPQPLAEVTLLKAKLMVPPPFPLWVDREPDKIAVSFVVRGACNGMGLNKLNKSFPDNNSTAAAVL